MNLVIFGDFDIGFSYGKDNVKAKTKHKASEASGGNTKPKEKQQKNKKQRGSK